MFTLTICTPTSYDCTAGYRVCLDKEYTLQEFIDAILTNKRDEWGKIRMAKRNCPWYDYPSIDYRYGNITNTPNIPEKVFGYKVKSVTASGGWTAMDYIITLEKEVK
uniref:Uncharacterized protein n=1 Tax=Siphoviridae sp. ctJT77 TaxID=2825432 RepID=A0A8S5UZJ2_9CAUD|nr:MAG TPA: hypothetical protein [Siphoviridae sp. ctJT77]